MAVVPVRRGTHDPAHVHVDRQLVWASSGVLHARLRAALVHLADGVPVTAVARRVGYETPSAFVAVFRRTLGVTPARIYIKPI